MHLKISEQRSTNVPNELLQATPDISAIVVTYNSSSTIAPCLNSLQVALAKNGEIIIIDNASRDNTLQLVKKNCSSSVRILRSPYNSGFASGVNKGIYLARGQYILLANPDLIINSDCIEGMMRFLKDHHDAAAVGPKLVYPNGEPQASCRRYPTFRAVLFSQFSWSTRIIGKKYLLTYLMQDTSLADVLEVEWLMGACIMIKRKTIEQVGFFDEGFFLYREDTDWCYRARRLGFKVFYHPHLKAIHHYKRESAKVLKKQFVWHLKSMLRFYRKHGFRF